MIIAISYIKAFECPKNNSQNRLGVWVMVIVGVGIGVGVGVGVGVRWVVFHTNFGVEELVGGS